MKWKDVYNKSNNSEKTQLININEPIKLEASFKKFLQSYKLVVTIVLIAFLIIAFVICKFNVKSFITCVLILFIAILISIYYNSYKVVIKDNKMKIKAQLNNIEINCDNLVTIFLSRKNVFLFIIVPINIYYINIVHYEEQKLNIITLPTIMNIKEEVYKFFKHLEFVKINANNN